LITIDATVNSLKLPTLEIGSSSRLVRGEARDSSRRSGRARFGPVSIPARLVVEDEVEEGIVDFEQDECFPGPTLNKNCGVKALSAHRNLRFEI
jgi:hypothetical protein